jgi:hypothetical protein
MEPEDEKAVRLLTEQLKELESIRGLNYKDPQFKAWRDTTKTYLERFLPPDSPHRNSFRNLRFFELIAVAHPHRVPNPNYISPEDKRAFVEGCKQSEATIRAVIKYIENFGVHVEQPQMKPAAPGRGGVHQTFHGPVTIQSQAIATDKAIQNIGHIGDATGSSLKEIAEVFRQSEELKQREVKEGLAAIEGLAVEIQKPEAKRNWKSVFDCGQAVLSIAGKATDLADKLGPHLNQITAFVQTAKHALGM